VTEQPTWCICFVHYGDPELTARAVQSAFDHHAGIPVIIVDDCAPDPFRSASEAVTVLRLARNSGYGTAVNTAFDWAISRGMHSIFIANNDVRLLEPVSALAASVAETAAVAPVMVDGWTGDRESWTVQNAGSLIDQKTGDSITLGRGMLLGACDPTARVDYLCGAAAQYNLAAVAEIGGFRDDYFLFWEDVEWCHRATAAGYALRVDPSVVVAHESTATIQRYVDVNMYYRVRNEAWFALQTRDKDAQRRYIVRFLFVAGPHRMLSAARRVGLKGAYWVFRGVVDGVRNPGRVAGGPRPT
jgi:N-acetylglucosaminyl-diphospho-decaprenol L-rhamnosyltransferase